VVIVAAARTPVGTFRGALAGLTAPELGTVAIKGALARSGVCVYLCVCTHASDCQCAWAVGVKPEDVDHVLMGNVVSAALGQAPARQAQLRAGAAEPWWVGGASLYSRTPTHAGIPNTSEATTINKVCASGMKAITMAAQSIMLGHDVRRNTP
jgi:acetyl-CoA C-acetyltransferase